MTNQESWQTTMAQTMGKVKKPDTSTSFRITQPHPTSCEGWRCGEKELVGVWHFWMAGLVNFV